MGVGLHTFYAKGLVSSGCWGYRIRTCRSRPIEILHEIVDAKDIPHELGYAGAVDLTSTARLELLHPFDAASTNLHDKRFQQRFACSEVDLR